MDLLNPHCFTNEDLIQILSGRHLQIDNLGEKSFNELLELYYNFVMPLHQRNTYRKDDIPNGTIKNSNIKLNNGSSNHRLKNQHCTDNKDISRCNANGYKHKRIEFSNDIKSEDSGGMPKKLKYINDIRNDTMLSRSSTITSLKRPAENSIDTPSKHKKITWP